MLIYVDVNDEYKAHVANDGNMVEFETDFFDGKCPEFVEGYRVVLPGHIWERSDGVAFHGLMLSPWKPYNELERAQAAYEHELLVKLQAQAVSLEAAESAYQEGVNAAYD